MGLFGKLFEKKQCAICGGEIGLLGNRKLEDGNMCKHCAAKLSPWFSDRRESTVAQIEAQLQYREENRSKLDEFQVSKRIGEYYKMFIEEVNGVPTRFAVCRDDYRAANADIIAFKNVSFCNIDIREHRKELDYLNENKERVKYNPPRYEYQYDFYVEMGIKDNPYFDEIKFKLNNNSVDITTEQYGNRSSHGIGRFLMDNREFDPSFNPEYREYKKMADELNSVVAAGQQGKPVIKFEDALLGALNQLSGQNTATAPTAEPVQEATRPKFCTNCGAPASEGKFCQHCGSPL